MNFTPFKSFTPYKRKIEIVNPIPNFPPFPLTVPLAIPLTIPRTEHEIFQPIKVTLKIIEGFASSPHEKQYGGRENRLSLPRHVIGIDLPLNYQTNHLLVVCSSHGRKTQNELVELEKLGQSGLRLTNGQLTCTFEKLILHHASHNYGQKLHLNFSLVDGFSYKEYGSVQSASFETITRRGKEKKKKKDTKSGYSTIEPSVGPLKGDMIVKISGNDITTTPTINPQDMTIKFGALSCTTIYLATSDYIICSTPPSTEPGEVSVQISHNKGRTFISTGLKFNYVNDDNESRKLFLNHFFKESEIQENPLKKIKKEESETQNLEVKEE